MKPLNIEETRLKEEMKSRCLNKGQYIDKNAKAKYDMICHLEDFEVQYWELERENQDLKKQLDYLRSGEYYNQLRFENEMLQQVVDTNGVPSEIYDYIDCTHRNTELLEENQELKKQLEELNDLIDTILNFSFFKEECPLNFGFENNTNEGKSQSIFYEDEWCENNCNDNYKDCWLKYFKKLQELEQGSDE